MAGRQVPTSHRTQATSVLYQLSYSELLPKPESNRRLPRFKRSNPILTTSKLFAEKADQRTESRRLLRGIRRELNP